MTAAAASHQFLLWLVTEAAHFDQLSHSPPTTRPRSDRTSRCVRRDARDDYRLSRTVRCRTSCANGWESGMVVRIFYRVPAIDVPPSTLYERCFKSENHVLRAAATEYLRLGVGFWTYAYSTGHAEHATTEHRMTMVVSRRAQLPLSAAEREVSVGGATLLHIAPAYSYSRCWPDHVSQWYRNRSPPIEP